MNNEPFNHFAMKRTIKSFSSLTDVEKKLIRQKYPYGFGPQDIQSLKTANSIKLEVLEVPTEDTLYLIKVNQDLLNEFYEPNDFDAGDDLWNTSFLETNF